MSRNIALLTLVSLALLGCATPAPVSPQQRFTAWMTYRGEVMLFSTRQDYVDALTHPALCNAEGQCESRLRCISGVLAGDRHNLSAWDGQRVVVTGQIVDYATLPDNGEPVLPRKLLAGKVVSNFCLRNDVMLITTIKLA